MQRNRDEGRVTFGSSCLRNVPYALVAKSADGSTLVPRLKSKLPLQQWLFALGW